MADKRPDIPDPMKREIRQRCGFGCVVCGLPLYDYEHVEGWANVQRHVEGEITLLCAQHHREKTNGLMTYAQVRRANENPINVSRGVSAPFGLHFELDKYSTVHAVIGGNRFSTSRQTQTALITVDDIDLVWVRIDENGYVFLHLNIFDELNNLALIVVGNELQFTSSLWDVTFEGTTLTLREAKQSLLLQITFLPPRTISIDRGCLLCNGVEVVVTPNLIYCDGRLMAGSISHNCEAGLIIGRNQRGIGAGYAWPDVQRRTAEQRRTCKQGATKAGSELQSRFGLHQPHVATGTERYVSTVEGSEDFHIIDGPIDSETDD